MSKAKILFITLFALSLFFHVTDGIAKPAAPLKTVQVMGTPVVIPEIEGFTEMSQFPPIWHQIELTVPEAMVLVAAYIQNDELKRMATGQLMQPREYIVLQSPKSAAPITDAAFESAKADIKATMKDWITSKDMIDSEFDRISNAYKSKDMEVQLKPGQNVTIGKFLENKKTIGTMNILNMSADVDGKTLNINSAAAVNLMHIKDRAILMMVYRDMSLTDSLVWAKKASLYLINQMMLLNPDK